MCECRVSTRLAGKNREKKVAFQISTLITVFITSSQSPLGFHFSYPDGKCREWWKKEWFNFTSSTCTTWQKEVSKSKLKTRIKKLKRNVKTDPEFHMTASLWEAFIQHECSIFCLSFKLMMNSIRNCHKGLSNPHNSSLLVRMYASNMLWKHEINQPADLLCTGNEMLTESMKAARLHF